MKSCVNAPDDSVRAQATARSALLTGGARPMLAQGGLVLFQRLELLRFEQHLFGRAFPIPWKRLEYRQAAPSSGHGEQEDGGPRPEGADGSGGRIDEKHHGDERKG